MLRLTCFSLLLLLFACQDNSKSPADTNQHVNTADQTQAEPAAQNISGCYLRSLKRDTLVASLQQHGDSITGKLTFDNFEKDGSSGSVHGYIDNGVIKLLYAFRSEGMNSVMEVYLKAQGDSLLQGVGERTNRGDTVFFASPSSVSYQENMPLKKTDCAKLDERFR